ncbi:MAG: beta-galactosidase, partial [Cellvibrio sp.]
MKLTRRRTLQLMATASSFPVAPLAWAKNSPVAATQAKPPTQGQPYKIKRLIHCACYYPELWAAEDIDRDIAEMKLVGINTIRMGEFGWSLMEPKEGKISIKFFKLVMDKLHAANIGVVFCTPTATPPVWLTHGHRDRLFVNADGQTLIHGARQHVTYEHPAVRKACFKIVEACAKELGNHPALIAWQIDNELKCHVAEDFSAAAINEWHKWLKRRFGTIEKLNEAWGTHMWSQYYHSFEQVPAPLKTPFMHSASLSTAYRMFCRESIADFADAQSAIIRRYSQLPITHNTNPAFSVNHERLFKNLDFASYDAYPSSQVWSSLVFRSDMYRAAIPGRPFWLMETSASYNGWLGEHSPAHPVGFLVAEAVLVYGLGSEAFSYWLWRQQRTGVEIAHSAIMSAWFKPGTGYEQVKLVEAARKQLEPLLLSSKTLVPDIAITWSDHARAMIETEPMDKSEG